MKIDFKPVRKRINLAEYALELEGGHINVQVNVSRETRVRMLTVSEKTPRDEFLGLLQELWGEEWPLEDIQALYDHCNAQDPQLWKWVTQKTWEAVLEYQGLAKKK